MTKRHSTKKALMLSLLSLVVCVAMLIGTTFAWFTDSVTSSGNIIKAGKLDVTLEWMDGTKAVADVDDAAWLDASTDAIFNYSLWEPGYTQVRHVKIGNEGNLALKYKVVIEADNADTDLAEVIDVYYFDPAEKIDGRDDLVASKYIGTLSEVLGTMNSTAQGTLAADTDDVITIALKMKESAGNNYMNKSVGGEFSVKVYATQLASEADAFGSDYDEAATYPSSTTTKVDDTTAPTPIKSEEVTVTVPAGADAGDYTVAITNKSESTNVAGETVVTYDINLLKDGVKVAAGTETFTVSIEVEKMVTISSVTHNGNPVANYDYDPFTGIITFETDSFSPFAVAYAEVVGDYPVDNADILADAVNKGGNFVLADDITLDSELIIAEDVVVSIDLAGNDLNAGDDGYVIENNAGTLILGDSVGNGTVTGVVYTESGCATTVNGGIYKAKAGSKFVLLNCGKLVINDATVYGGTSYAIYSYNDGHELIINDATVTAPFGCVNCYGEGTVEINGGSFTATGAKGKTHHCVYIGTASDMVINGGTFAHNGAGVSDSGATITAYAGANGGIIINGGNFSGSGTYIAPFDKYDTKCYFTINGGTFTKDPAKYVPYGYASVDNEDGTWTVKKAVTSEEELKDAIENGDGEIVLGDDIFLGGGGIIIP